MFFSSIRGLADKYDIFRGAVAASENIFNLLGEKTERVGGKRRHLLSFGIVLFAISLAFSSGIFICVLAILTRVSIFCSMVMPSSTNLPSLKQKSQYSPFLVPAVSSGYNRGQISPLPNLVLEGFGSEEILLTPPLF